VATIESKVTTELTPKIIAKAFAHMGSDGQAEFFEHLAAEVKATFKCGYGFGEMQWCHMAEDLKKRGGDANAMYHALSTFAFEFSQDNCGLQHRIA